MTDDGKHYCPTQTNGEFAEWCRLYDPDNKLSVRERVGHYHEWNKKNGELAAELKT